MKFFWAGRSAVFLEVEGISILVDPGDLVKPSDVDRVDLLLYTHEHSGHYDYMNLKAIYEAHRPHLVVNKGVFKLIRRKVPDDKLTKLKAGEMVDLDFAKVHALRAVHPGVHPLVYLIEVGGKAIFHGDSSGYSSYFQAFSPVDVAFLPVGKPSPNASPKDASKMAKELVPLVSVPIHGEPQEMEDFSIKVKAMGLETQVIVPEPGRVYELD